MKMIARCDATVHFEYYPGIIPPLPATQALLLLVYSHMRSLQIHAMQCSKYFLEQYSYNPTKGKEPKDGTPCQQFNQPPRVRRPLYLVLVKDLVSVLQDRVHDLDLPSGVLDGSAGVCPHEGGAEDDGQVVRVHAVDVR
jgi:hypothetical protein